MQVDFYHLTTTPLDRALPQIAEKVVASGARLLIVADDAEQRAHLDRLLWSYTLDSFLPHALAGTGDDARQPVLIAATPDAANGARHIALVDGRWRMEALGFERAFHFFADDHIEAARGAWRGLAETDGVERRYWKQSDAGRWERAA
ncbi:MULTISPECIES: DNA polymerase III subunit chi [unclassified Sphingomonas]|jgi:DNA polymerase III subunit chi|uniref:DNA polymerase III subunit chi n=1 Tax=unclassified Sphingomonas TaxID=196159 RepID=UPI000E106D91|nr:MULTISPECIES: DNA polymerase III subunit chi [unclassified Sphingomonas]AXJ96561.1 DNA polymerase III subunit chi [Sphingomonas sp. FARSPH]